jgi:hypothetical protein
MNELTITKLRKITGWSYPTAFKFAREHGRFEDGLWLVPYNDVAAIVQKRVVEAAQMQNRLVAVTNGSN